MKVMKLVALALVAGLMLAGCESNSDTETQAIGSEQFDAPMEAEEMSGKEAPEAEQSAEVNREEMNQEAPEEK